MTLQAAERVVARQCEGILRPDVVLPFDDPDLSPTTVADVLADPLRFIDETLADPLEGVEYGRCKAKVLRRSDGSVFINSFAHGGTIYELRSDARSVRAAMERADAKDIVRTFVSLAVLADLDNDENEELKNLAAARAKVGKRVVGKMLQEAWKNRDEQRAKSQHDERLAQRRDPRPAIGIPAPDAPYTREMEVFNDVLGRSPAVEPPLRDMDGNVTQSRKRRIPTLHLFTSQHHG
jgi:hypothetical protein